MATEFKTFLQENGVKYHKRMAPYHPSTNGQAERANGKGRVEEYKDDARISASQFIQVSATISKSTSLDDRSSTSTVISRSNNTDGG